MRTFPRAPRRLLAALVTATVLAGILAIPAAQADDQQDLRDKQKSVQGQIKSKTSDLEESSAEVSAAGAALLAAKGKLLDARAQLASVQDQLEQARGIESQLQAKLVDTQASLVTARAQYAAGQAATAAQREVVANTITDIYEQGNPQLLAFASILEAQTPADVTRQLNFKDVVVGKQDTAYDDLSAAEVQLAKQQAGVERAEADVTVQRDAAVQNVEEIQALRQQAEGVESDVVSLVSSRQDARASARAAQAADQRALEQLNAQEADVKRQILAAKKAALAAAKAKAAAAAAAAADQGLSAAGGGAAGGPLLAPVVGSVTSPFGYRRHPIYGYWGLHDGTDFGVSCGEGLRAAGDGTVLSTVYSSVYGNRLYLDLGIVDGKSLTVVYNHMSGYAKSAGDVVSRGEIVGYVGSTGWSTGCHLHFTVLVDGEAVDPRRYL